MPVIREFALLLSLAGVLSTPAGTSLFSALSDVSRAYATDGSAARLKVYRLEDPESSRFKLTFIAYVAPEGTRLTVSAVGRSGSMSGLMEEVTAKRGALAAVNGGFFGFDRAQAHMPLGLVVADGKRMRPLHPWKTGGVVFATPNSVSIVPINAFAPPPDTRHALQSKPLLVEQGRSGIRSDDGALFDRSAVGLTNKGQLLLFGAFIDTGQAVSLGEFAALIVDWAKAERHGLGYVLAMDGGPSSHLYIPKLKLHFGSEHQQYVPNAVVLESR